ncbi:AAA family ATPase, partial [Candidatus Berkelbacteria bacterium]|nr:AAA family ATPase [Candidatus Berkelbacteria bacterium]
MSEFMEKHATSKLIGAPPGYVGFEEAGQLTEQIRRRPYSVILFDEIEKAHPDVFNIMLQILDDGRLTDAKGRVVNFKNTIIVMTSNIGSNIIQDFANNRQSSVIGYQTQENVKSDEEQMGERINAELAKFFKPEFINRVDELIIFRALTKDQIGEIVEIQLERVAKRIKKQRQINLVFDKKSRALLAKKGYDPAFGARPLKRVVQKEILDPLAMILLAADVPPDTEIGITAHGEQIVIEPPPNIELLEKKVEQEEVK